MDLVNALHILPAVSAEPLLILVVVIAGLSTLAIATLKRMEK